MTVSRIRPTTCSLRPYSHTLRAAPCLLAVAALLSFPCAGERLPAGTSGASLYKQGVAAEAREDFEAAYSCYHQAFERAPQDLRFKTAYERVRVLAASVHVSRGERLEEQGEWKLAVLEFMRGLEMDPSNDLAKRGIGLAQQQIDHPSDKPPETPLHNAALKAMDSMRSPVELKPLTTEPLTLHMVEDSRVIYQSIGKLGGLNIIFDPDYTSKRVALDLTGVSVADALGIVASLSNTFWRPVTSNTIFVALNTRGKRTELDQQGIQTFFLANAAQQNDLNDMQTALRNVLPNAKLYGVPSQNAIVMRATPDELMLAQKLISDLDKARPEVVVDVAVIEVSRDKLREIGIQLPQSASVNLQASVSSTTSSSTSTSSSLTLNTLGHLNGTNFAVTVGEAQAEMLLSDSDTRVLQNPRVRATDGQQAILKIGSRIPIATGSYTASTSSSSSGTQTQFQYVDIGVNIDMKPTIHYNRDVTLKLKIEVSAHDGDSTISGVTEPIISQRTIEQVVRLKEGEANIVGGVLERSESLAVSGTPGLGELPLIKYLFSTQKREVIDDEIVFLLIPHIVRATELSPLNVRDIDSGTTNAVEVRRAEPATLLEPLGRGATAPTRAPNATPTIPGAPAISPEAPAKPLPHAALEPLLLRWKPDAPDTDTAAPNSIERPLG